MSLKLALPLPNAAVEAMAPVMLEHAILWLNHVLVAEPAATKRLLPHAGRLIELAWTDDPAAAESRPPRVVCRITPAGLFERVQGETTLPPVSLHIRPGAPATQAIVGWLAGERPPLTIEGDSTLAADINWLADNLRWDVADDLALVFGPSAAREMARAGGLLVAVARQAARFAADLGRDGNAGSAAR